MIYYKFFINGCGLSTIEASLFSDSENKLSVLKDALKTNAFYKNNQNDYIWILFDEKNKLIIDLLEEDDNRSCEYKNNNLDKNFVKFSQGDDENLVKREYDVQIYPTSTGKCPLYYESGR